jgi:F-type H+-transporting ATPase subunit delta
MQEEKIARRYARAIMLAVEDDAILLKVESDFAEFSKLFSVNHFDFLQIMFNPVFCKEERKTVLSQLGKQCSWRVEVLNLSNLLIDKERMRFVPVIYDALSREIDEKLGRVRVDIATVEELLERDLQEIVGALQTQLGKIVVAKTKIEQQILGGVRAQVGGLVFDHTLETQINSLEKLLLSSSLSN